jgi:hypothetical protein
MSNQSLATLVAIYRRKDVPRIAAYLEYFQKLESLDDAIRFACHGKEGILHSHQHLVGKEKVEQARKQLKRCADDIDACKSFDTLLGVVEDCTSSIARFGVLAVYDTALRLGAFLGKWPKVVYLHAGTKKGCKALGVPTKGGKVEIEKLPQAIQVLEAYQAEDFLCIFKDQFGGAGRVVKRC